MKDAKTKRKPRKLMAPPAAGAFQMTTLEAEAPPAEVRRPAPREDLPAWHRRDTRDSEDLRALGAATNLVEEIAAQVEEARAELAECKRRYDQATARLVGICKRLTEPAAD